MIYTLFLKQVGFLRKAIATYYNEDFCTLRSTEILCHNRPPPLHYRILRTFSLRILLKSIKKLDSALVGRDQ